MIDAFHIIKPDQHHEYLEWCRQHSDYLHYICLISPPRPGVVAFMTVLEYYHFPPGTPLNDVYEAFTLELRNGSTFTICSMPKAYRPIVLDLAPYFGLAARETRRLSATYDGKSDIVPVSGNAYSMEFVPNHPAMLKSGADVADYSAMLRRARELERVMVKLVQNGVRPNYKEFMKIVFE